MLEIKTRSTTFCTSHFYQKMKSEKTQNNHNSTHEVDLTLLNKSVFLSFAMNIISTIFVYLIIISQNNVLQIPVTILKGFWESSN